ncbi:Di-heme cytochrome c peroxidase [Desulfovibrio sp. X2]|uniref:cytochrome c peroxidase n=1 Tax=Desulfovibrio sp. X2 TaxID=941449 RepID=UPI000358E719|nr:cytochrome c peroxidase [Desulfovibrio sp. X2]EPR44721.1 Di-heme cytochrome c peroxidase [Desulfovibrio sp. X2]
MHYSATVVVFAASVLSLFLAAWKGPPAVADSLSAAGQPMRSADAVLAPRDEELLHRQAAMILSPLPEAMPGAEKDSPELVALGEKLFFETALSTNRTQSCNSCHRVDGSHAGVDNLPTSPGAMKKLGDRNAPTVLNAGFEIAQFWDGRSPDLADQAKGPILNPVEMGMPKAEEVMGRLEAAGYGPLFAKAFPGAAEPLTYDNLGLAIAAYERTLVTHDRFDAYLKGDLGALTSLEKRGLSEFMQTGCVRCHNGPTMGGLLFEKIGVVHPYDSKDEGRFTVTKRTEDRFVFKVPMLRNITMTGPYYHDGRVATLAEAVDRMAWLQLGVRLDNARLDSMLRFMTALADERRASAPPADSAPPAKPWTPPALADLGPGPDAELVRYGYLLLTDTYQYLGKPGLGYSGNVLACRSCHQETGTKAYGLSWMGVTGRYPRFRAREGRESTLAERINGCMQRSLAGRPLPADSLEMKAMIAYMGWLSGHTPKENAGLLAVRFDLPARAADPAKGKEHYAVFCQNCHGAHGQGYQPMAAEGRGSYSVPPLWGAGAYNIGAGMARLLTATAFIQANMPLGAQSGAPALSVEEAYDVAAYVNSQARPQMAGLESDWPDKVTKPVDSPYGPYADGFPPAQHRLGPFGPLKAWQAAHRKQ